MQLEVLLGSMELLQDSVKGLEGAVEQIQGDTYLCCNNSDPNATSGNECVCLCAHVHMITCDCRDSLREGTDMCLLVLTHKEPKTPRTASKCFCTYNKILCKKVVLA